MKIALISYEYPPDTGFGGIGTYTRQLANVLAVRGHYIEIFSCSHTEEKLLQVVSGSITLHRVKATNRFFFSHAIVELFRERNKVIQFDLIESPEYCAEGLPVRLAFPSIPMIVKLHTPLFLIKRLNELYNKQSFKRKLKKLLGRKMYDKNFDKDYELVSLADAICSPSFSLAKVLEKEWELKNIEIIPNIFIPNASLSGLPIGQTDCNVISYVGRLDVRKGILAIVKAIPFVLRKYPHIKFRFIGGDGEAPNKKGSMKAYMLRELRKYAANIEFTGYIKHEHIPNYLEDTGIVIMPSIWENYPYTCLEMMSAGKAIIASRNGGMKEMLSGDGGILIDPLKPKEIARAIISLIDNPKLRGQMGEYNRAKTLTVGTEVSLHLEAFYANVVQSKTILVKPAIPEV